MAELQPEQTRPERSSTRKDPGEGETGDDSMTGAQRSYLETLADEAHERVETQLTKAEAARQIERLQQATGRTRRKAGGSLADAVADRDTELRVAQSLERIADTVEKILGVLARSAEQRRERPRQDFRAQPPGEEGRRPSGYPRRDRYPESRGPYGRPGRRWNRDDRMDRGR